MKLISKRSTAGQERFGTLMSSYYRGAHGIILVYDVTRRETFTNLLEIWAKELELYSTNPDCIKILVGNKVDKDSVRAVTVEEGMDLAQKHKCLFLECSAKTRENVQQCFKELTMKVITINGMFPGPLINATTNDVVHVNVFNNLDEPLLITWNGIQQRLNSWQDGVSGTNCPIEAGSNWTYVFQTKDQMGTFTYFPSINFHKVAGGYGPIRVNNRNVILVPFAKPEAEFDLLIGDWFEADYKEIRSLVQESWGIPDVMLMNGKAPYGYSNATDYESFTVTKGKTYRIRVSNVGSVFSFNFRIQNHKMVLVETEGSYTNQIILDSLDVHVGQSYSVLVTANQDEADYYMVASPKLFDTNFSNTPYLVGNGVLHYANSVGTGRAPVPNGPDPFDIEFSINQAKSVRWNLTTGAARPNPQGTFNVSNITLTQSFILHGSKAEINGTLRYVVNNVSYLTLDTALKLADYFRNGSGVYELDAFPVRSVNDAAAYGTSVVTGVHKGWLEIVFNNGHEVMDSWHLDGFGFYVVGFGEGEWTPESRNTYNLYDPVVRSTVQVYPGRWTAVYAFLDNPGMWNLRSQNLQHWYLGQELYVRIHDDDPNPAKERPPPENLLLCGIFDESPSPSGAPAPQPRW
ncbi:monocopper oxidase-like protein SKU5 isoform X2 [Olea europaea var. sylvestris]|uniref:monocopper oxidase-like protein SKU5 isoform X2 n=1 Tax=Olea europaea var. sylvestris TaxID=158386 RepID=UPI000C1D3BB2|nr:monocopper oxidase-like protein SKU5 isoform X2 [Olea europaea var. sylvestris]